MMAPRPGDNVGPLQMDSSSTFSQFFAEEIAIAILFEKSACIAICEIDTYNLRTKFIQNWAPNGHMGPRAWAHVAHA